jgi:hypothetical protein
LDSYKTRLGETHDDHRQTQDLSISAIFSCALSKPWVMFGIAGPLSYRIDNLLADTSALFLVAMSGDEEDGWFA